MEIITKVVVGSRLHGLHNENSDWDYRGIHIHPLKEVLSPFRKTKTTSWIEGNVDDTSYELADFCKQATTGNATILEVFFSSLVISSSATADEMRENWKKFMDTDRFVAASRGYAHNQYNKMSLFDPDHRTGKFAVAYCRVLWQCAEFLRSGTFPCEIQGPLKPFLLDVKNNFSRDMIPLLSEKFVSLQKDVTDAYASAEILKPDLEWIEEFIYRAYTNND